MVRPSQVEGRSLHLTSLLRIRWMAGGLIGLAVGVTSVAAIHCLPFQIARVFALPASPVLATVQLVRPAGAAAAALLTLGSVLLYAVYGLTLVDREVRRFRWPWLIAIPAAHCVCFAAWNGLLIRGAIEGLLP
jgi:hypothetical protein